MAVKSLDNKLREKYVKLMMEWLESIDEVVLDYKTNEVCIPTVDEAGNDKYVKFIVQVPKGSREGDEFDGYAMHEEFIMKQKEKEEKAKADAEKKAKKIEHDRQAREAKKKAKAEE